MKVTFLPENKTFEFEHGKLPYQEHGKPQSLLDVALNFGFHLEHACGGNCACTTCHVVVKKGKELLSPMEDDEADKLDMAADLQLESRLGCQSIIEKPARSWSKFRRGTATTSPKELATQCHSAPRRRDFG